MKGLLLKVLLFLGLFIGANGAEIIQMTFRLPTYPQVDRDLYLIQKFLIAQTEKETASLDYQVTFNEEGELEIQGDQDKMHPFVAAFERWISAPFTKEVFLNVKESYLKSLAELGGFDERALLEEMDYEAAMKGKETLQPFSRMMQSAASALCSNPQAKLVSNDPNYKLFYSLSISEEQQKATSKLVKKMADSNYWTLLKERKELDKLGDKVIPVHPLRFIGYIYGNPTLKKGMGKILNDIFKRRGFLNGHGKKEGFSQRMTKEAQSNNLMQYLPGFAQSLGVSQSSIEVYFYSHDWEGLLRHLAK